MCMSVRALVCLCCVHIAISAGHLRGLNASALPKECLCVFDVDRTLTGKQNQVEICRNNTVTNCEDNAYGSGDLTLSQLGDHLDDTFCEHCYVGIVTAGNAGGVGSCERERLEEQLNISGKLLSAEWSGPSRDKDDRKSCKDWPVDSPLVAGCADGTKQFAVQGIVNWLNDSFDIDIAKADVWFFDDRQDNVEAFNGTGINARQISCTSRNPGYTKIGFCGAKTSEIVRELGVHVCDAN